MNVSLPAAAPRFAAYHAEHPTWGCLHIVLADGNVRYSDVAYCLEEAELHGDTEGAHLANFLLKLSKTQRKKLGYVVRDYERSCDQELKG